MTKKKEQFKFPGCKNTFDEGFSVATAMFFNNINLVINDDNENIKPTSGEDLIVIYTLNDEQKFGEATFDEKNNSFFVYKEQMLFPLTEISGWFSVGSLIEMISE